MTLGLAAIHNGTPLLIADIILSGDGTQPGISIPTLHDISGIACIERKVPVRLEQKTVIPADNMAFTWSGDHYLACMAMDRLRVSASQGKCSVEDVSRILCGFHEKLWDKISLVGIVAEGGMLRKYVCGESIELNTPLLDAASVIGSGSADISSGFVFNPSKNNSGCCDITQHGRNPAAEAVCTGLIVASTLMRPDSSTAWCTKNLYGGFYEVVYMNDGRFQKCDDATYVTWVLRIDQDRVSLQKPDSITRGRYVDGTLYVRVRRKAAGSMPADDNTYVVLGANCKEAASAIATPGYFDNFQAIDFNTSWRCSSIVVIKDGAFCGAYSLVDYDPQRHRSHVSVVDDNGSQVISVSNEYLDLVRTEAAKILGAG